MGTWAPISISAELDHNIRKKVIEPTMKQISQSKSPYRGVIFLGIMVNGNEPLVLETMSRWEILKHKAFCH